jgi:hypothetical protein
MLSRELEASGRSLLVATLFSLFLGCSVNSNGPTLPPVKNSSLAQIFLDRTPGSGIDFTYHNGKEADHYAILESLGGGVALIDYDGDGLLDIFFTGGGYFDGPDKKQIEGYPCKLYKNLGNFRFKDVTAEVGLNIPWFYTHTSEATWPALPEPIHLAILALIDSAPGRKIFSGRFHQSIVGMAPIQRLAPVLQAALGGA